MSLYRSSCATTSYHLNQTQTNNKKREEEDRSMYKQIEHCVSARTIKPPVKTILSCRCAFFCIAVSLYPVWADVDAIYQVLKQAGEIRGNSTNSPPTPPTAEHLPSGAAPSSARASSHPCSSSTSGKAHHQTIPTDLGTYVGIFPENYTTDSDGLCLLKTLASVTHQNLCFDRMSLFTIVSHSSL